MAAGEDVGVEFLDIAMTDLGPPVAESSELKKVFWDGLIQALSGIGVSDFHWMLLMNGGEGATDPSTYLAVYHDTDSVLAARLTDDGGTLDAWLRAIAGRYANSPFQLHKGPSQSGGGRALRWNTIAEDPTIWLTAWPPTDWVARGQAAEKQSLLAEAEAVAGPAAGTDYSRIPGLWAELVGKTGLESNPGASEAQLAEFKNVSGYDLPEGLATLLRESNGADRAFLFTNNLMRTEQDVDLMSSEPNMDLLSIEQVTTIWTSWNQAFDTLELGDLCDYNTPDRNMTVGFYTTPKWVPFADESGGNYTAIDLLPGPAGQKGQVITFGHDEHVIRVNAGDIVEFLEQQLKSINLAQSKRSVNAPTDPLQSTAPEKPEGSPGLLRRFFGR